VDHYWLTNRRFVIKRCWRFVTLTDKSSIGKHTFYTILWFVKNVSIKSSTSLYNKSSICNLDIPVLSSLLTNLDTSPTVTNRRFVSLVWCLYGMYSQDLWQYIFEKNVIDVWNVWDVFDKTRKCQSVRDVRSRN
jgi:hypothetical protein